MSFPFWALALIGLSQLDGDRPSLHTHVICYGAVLLVWLLFFTAFINWR